MSTLDDIGRMSHGLRDNAKDLFDIWMYQPSRRADFGERELQDIRDVVLGLGVLLREIEKSKPALKVVSR
jgi:hypothetical protein